MVCRLAVGFGWGMGSEVSKMIKIIGSLVLCLVLAACAPLPVVPDGMILVPKTELTEVLESYSQLVKEHKELLELREYRDSMFF
jgi:hypothetical protein